MFLYLLLFLFDFDSLSQALQACNEEEIEFQGWALEGRRTGSKGSGDTEPMTGGSHLSGRTKKAGRSSPCFNIR
jgi:hypothetical protein